MYFDKTNKYIVFIYNIKIQNKDYDRRYLKKVEKRHNLCYIYILCDQVV